ncbi:MAG TPA: carbohydrate ABC transporter permease [Anaerolineaceae bacterium]|nr:carbohydrate ABC transporter permease [Anaerolineaceae bacterium]HPN53621.1 carbohydrate ABC transporter permease [Anaerolineaceae bacterium]
MKTQKPFRFYLGRFVLYAVLVVSSITMIIPFYWAVSTSLKMEQFVFSNPPQWFPNPPTLQAYLSVFTRINFGKYFLNSVFVAVITTLGHVFFDTLAAYAFAKLTFPGRDKIFFVLLLGLMVPFQVNLIPLYRIMATLGWTNTYLALIVPNLTSIFGIFMMRQFLKSIPNDLLDAGRIDGCSEFGVFWRIVAPLALPGIATLIILTFMGTWNDFLWPRLVTSSEALFTLPVGLAQLQAKNTSNVAQIMAGTVLTALPMIIVFLFMQRQFIEGMTAGALKE